MTAGTVALGEPIIEVPILGGSLPLTPFNDVLHAPLVVLPIANHDDAGLGEWRCALRD